MLCPDDEDFLDREQGIPHLKGLPCRLNNVCTENLNTGVAVMKSAKDGA
jgi:hypothetical protein